MSERVDVLVFSERPDVARELLSLGRRLAADLGAGLASVSVGQGAAEEAREHLSRGVDRALAVVPVPPPEVPDEEAGRAALHRAVTELEPKVVLVGATVCGVEVAARVAQALGTGCLGDGLEVRWEAGALIARRRVLGRFVATQRLSPGADSTPLLATVPPRQLEAPPREDGAGGEVETLAVEVPPGRLRRVESRLREENGVDLEGAEVVVGVGRGLARAEDLPLVEELARVLGGVVGATRPLTDELGWLPSSSKIGLSGRTVRPRLYIACGISGQIEHLVGIEKAEVVVAINRDPDAPICKAADYVLVGDLYELVPALTRALGQHLGREGRGAEGRRS